MYSVIAREWDRISLTRGYSSMRVLTLFVARIIVSWLHTPNISSLHVAQANKWTNVRSTQSEWLGEEKRQRDLRKYDDKGPEWCYKSIHCNLSYVCHRLYHFLVLVRSGAFYHLYSPQLSLLSSSFFTSPPPPPIRPSHLFLNDLSLFSFVFYFVVHFFVGNFIKFGITVRFLMDVRSFFDRYKCHCCCGCRKCVYKHTHIQMLFSG